MMEPGPAQDINVTVIGKGARRDLDIPPQIDHRVEFYSGLPYPVSAARRTCV